MTQSEWLRYAELLLPERLKYEPEPEQEESDLDYHGQHEPFTPRY